MLVNFIQLSKIKVDTQTNYMVDEYGRKRIYHGVNVVFKKFPFYPINDHFDSFLSLADIDLQNLKKWGMNVIRLYLPWEGLEPKMNEFNYTLLNKIYDIVEKCNQFNISVLLDAHQDLLNRRFCGEGSPTWVNFNSDSFPQPLFWIKLNKDENGFPEQSECLKTSFTEFYPTFDVSKAFQDLYENKNGIADHFANMWGIAANKFKNSSNVIGYEIINEPWFGDIFNHPSLVISSDEKNLLPFYIKVSQKIRNFDNETIIFFEPSVLDIFKFQNNLHQTPEGINYLDRQILSYHVYCLGIIQIKILSLLIDPQNELVEFFCEKEMEYNFKIFQSKQKELKIGGFMTEFGGMYQNSFELQQIMHTISLAETHFQSWTYWQFKYYDDITTSFQSPKESFYDQDGNEQIQKITILSMPYAYAICGTPISSQFFHQNKTFIFEQIMDSCQNKFTELYINEELIYLNGFDVDFGNRQQLTKLEQIEKNYYKLIIDEKDIGQRIKITITEKSNSN